jgi:hypothetical protein
MTGLSLFFFFGGGGESRDAERRGRESIIKSVPQAYFWEEAPHRLMVYSIV